MKKKYVLIPALLPAMMMTAPAQQASAEPTPEPALQPAAPAVSPAEAVDAVLETMKNDGITAQDSGNEWGKPSRKELNEIAEAAALVKEGKASLRDFAWVPKVLRIYSRLRRSADDDNAKVPMPVEAVRKLIAAGADVNAVITDRDDSSSESAVLTYVDDSLELCEMLLAAGADVNAGAANLCNSPLACALDEDRAAVFRCLVAAGANVNVLDDDGDNLLHRTICCGTPAECAMLIEAGIDINARNKDGKTPLDYAIRNGEEEVALMIINSGAELDESAYSPLYLACMFDRRETLQSLIDDGAELNEEFPSGATPLTMAASLGKSDLCRILIDAGADPDQEDGNGNLPLHVAARAGNAPLCELFIEAGADINAADGDGDIALVIAARRGRTTVVKSLIEHGVDVKRYSEKLLVNSVLEKYASVLKLLVDAGLDLNASRGTPGGTALHRNIYRSEEKIVNRLLELGADVNALNSGGETPLWCVINRASYDSYATSLACRLLEAGADPNILPKHSRVSSLISALLTENIETQVDPNFEKLCMLLIEKGSMPRAKSAEADGIFLSQVAAGRTELVSRLIERGMTLRNISPMLQVVALGNADRCRELLEAGADPNEMRIYMPMLALAARLGRADICKLLLEKGAKVNCDGSEGEAEKIWNPLTLAIIFEHADVVQMLLDAGSSVQYSKSQRLSPLSAAVLVGDVELVKRLLEKGAKVNDFVQTLSPLHYALVAEKNSEELVRILLAAGADAKAFKKYGRSPLTMALSDNDSYTLDTPVCRMLIEAGADPDAKDGRNDTARDIADKSRYARYSSYLRQTRDAIIRSLWYF